MPAPINLIITNAGLDALVDAQNSATEVIEVVEVGLTEADFLVAPTLTALPGEFKRIASFGGESVGPNIIHMSARDTTQDIYDLRGIGLYLSDGTLFAVFGQPDPIFRKVSIATFLLAFDVHFSDDIASEITFGDAAFLYPPATETVQGVAELATQAETDAGTDDERIVTPAKLAARLVAALAPIILSVQNEANARSNADDALQDAIDAEIAARSGADNDLQNAIDAEIIARGNADDALQALVDALRAITITGTGVASGGGNLTQNRQINVESATGAEALAEAIATKAITPQTLAGFARSIGQSGYAVIPGTGGLIIQHGRFNAAGNSATSVTWPIAFPSACYAAITDGALTDTAAQDNYVSFRAETISATGATAYNNQVSHLASYIAIGR